MQRFTIRDHIKTVTIAVVRFLLGLRGPSKATNQRLLHEHGETVMSLTIREATAADLVTLARLHVETWNATYPGVRSKPTYAIRKRQWREAFQVTDGSWFCFVIERRDGQLIGFAKGTRNAHPEFSGELNKIYLRREYQRLGLGRRLVGHVASRFLSQGISSMILFAEPQNPSCAFYEALGAERLRDDAGHFHGAYGWRDLPRLYLPH